MAEFSVSEVTTIIGLQQFSWVFIMDWVLVLFVSIFMLFYFNRVVGYIITVIAKSYLWHMHKVQVKVQSIQLSLLGGRLFFKNISYIGENETISILQGSFTWRYWLYRTRLSQYFEKDEKDCRKESRLPARFSLSIEGLEWFVYNRSAAYDLIADYLKESELDNTNTNDFSDAEEGENTTSPGESTNSVEEDAEPSNLQDQRREKSFFESFRPFSEMLSESTTGEEHPLEKANPLTHAEYLLLRAMPLQIKLSKGAAIFGNRSTPSLMVFRFEAGRGSVDGAKAPNQSDKYRMQYQINFTKPVIDFEANILYDENYSKGTSSTDLNNELPEWQDQSFLLLLLSSPKYLLVPFQLLKTLVFRKKKKTNGENEDQAVTGGETGSQETWHGLSRYQVNEGNEFEMQDFVRQTRENVLDGSVKEYGKFNTILDASTGSINFFYDIPGIIPEANLVQPIPTYSGADIGNNGSAPEWGVDVLFRNSTIHYGPWADRQRLPLQRMLYPLNYHTFQPAEKRKHGELRDYTEFKVFMELTGETIIRVPMRENSKNTQFAANAASAASKEEDSPETGKFLRPFGWVELAVTDTTSISFISSMTPTAKDGWKSVLTVDMQNLEVRTSVNHELLFSASSHVLVADISNTLCWNELQNWTISNDSYNVKMFLVREHIMLLSDLTNDFTDGVPTPYDLFTPFIYHLNWNIHDGYGIFLNINELNIINNPADFEENTYIAFKGQDLEISARMPFDQVFQKKNTVEFSLKTSCFDLVTCSPPWHTFDSFLVSENGGRAYNFLLKGSYTYFSKNESGTSDILFMECFGSDVTFIAYGFLIRYLLKIRENYFGENIHFQTLEEYNQKQSAQASASPTSGLGEMSASATTETPETPATEYTYTKLDNDLDVLLYVYVTNGSIVLPCNIYSAENHVLLNFASFDVDLRFTNYYMDLQVNISPIKGAHNHCVDHNKIIDFAHNKPHFEPTIFIDGIVVHGNRMFGLPPTEPTYLCKWDFDLGSVLINGPLDLLQKLEQVGSSAGYTYVDSENGLMIPEPIIYDVTYLSLKLKSIHLVLRVDQTGLEIKTNSISLFLNDLANNRYSSRITISIPSVKFNVYEYYMAQCDQKGFQEMRNLVASVDTSLMITDFIQKRNFGQFRERQQQHIALHDGPFGRCSFMLDENHRTYNRRYLGTIVPSIPINVMPPFVTNETLKFIDPNIIDSLNMEDEGKEDGDSSASSRSQFSFSDSASVSSPTKKDSHLENYQYNFNINDTDFNGNAFLPPESWKQFQQVVCEIKEKLPDFGLNPTCHYSNEEAICPLTPVDLEFEYDSFVIQIGDITGFASPLTMKSIDALLKTSQQQDLQSTMDQIQIDVLKTLNYIRNGKPEVKNFRVSVSSISLKYGKLTGNDGSRDEILRQYNTNISHLAISCDAIAIAYRTKKHKTPQADLGEYLANNEMEVDPSNLSVYFGCQNLTASVFRGYTEMELGSRRDQIHHTDYQPIFLQLENPEFWLHEDTDQNSGSFRLKNINLSIKNEHLTWVGTFLENNIHEFQKLQQQTASSSLGTVSSKHNRNRNIYVLRALSMASETFNIEEDPSVLTRHTFIMQSPTHVRANDSWKIMVRLRHILKSVPADWRCHQDKLVQENEFPPVVSIEEAKHDVLNVFSRWRSWELENMERSYLFRHIFNTTTFQETLLSNNLAIVVDLECLAIRLHQADKEDFVLFDYLKFALNWGENNLDDQTSENEDKKEPTEPKFTGAANSHIERLNVDCSLGCSNARSNFSQLSLNAIEQIIPFFDQDEEDIASPISPTTYVSFKSKEEETKTYPLFSISATGCVENLSMGFNTPTFSVNFGTKGISVSAFIEQNESFNFDDIGASLSAHFQHIEFHLSELGTSYEPDLVLVTLSLDDYKGSITSSGPLMTAPKYLSCTNDQFQLLVNKPVEYLTNVVIKVIDVDYPLLLPLINKLSNNGNYDNASVVITPSPSNSNKSSKENCLLRFPVFVKVSCNTSEIRLNATASWCLYFATSQTDINATMSTLLESLIQSVCEFKTSDFEVGILVTSNRADNDATSGVKRVTSITLPSFQAELSLEETVEMICAELLVDLESFEIRTLALTSALRLLGSDMTRNEIEAMMNAIKVLSKKIEVTFGNDLNKITRKKSSSSSVFSSKNELLANSSASIVSDKPSFAPLFKNKPFCFNANLLILHTIAVVPSLESSLVLEMKKTHLAVSSFYRDSENKTFIRHPWAVETSVDDLFFILQNDNWSVHTSTILRLHFSALYSEATDSNHQQQFDITSNHFHIMLCQRVVEKMVEILTYIEEGLEGVNIQYSNDKQLAVPSTPPASSTASSASPYEKQFESLKKFTDRTTFKIALSQFCLAWLFEEGYSDNDYTSKPDAKGLLFGYDSLLITTHLLQGRTLLNGVYLTPTFNENDMFHLQTDKSNAVNTGFLPQVQLITLLSVQGKGEPPLAQFKLSGDSLKISIMPSIVSIVVSTVKSITATLDSVTKILLHNKKGKRSAATGDENKQSSSPGANSANFPKYSLPVSVYLTVGFDGATISFWNPMDVTSGSNRREHQTRAFNLVEGQEPPFDPTNVPKPNAEPSLWLQAPAIDAVVEYTKGKAQTRDKLNGEIQIMSSANKIYPKVMPCFHEMSKLIQDLFKTSTLPKTTSNDTETANNQNNAQQNSDSAASDTNSVDSKSPSDEIDLEEQFGNIIVDVRVRLARQEIMLSCEPTAKVAATVAYDDFFIGVNSTEEGLRKTSYSLSARLTNFKFSLQHIYSREVSGMISIDNIILFATKDRSSFEQQAILTAGTISDINAEVNMKQSQDLELFQDIWYPGKKLSGDYASSAGRQSTGHLDQMSQELFKQSSGGFMDGAIIKKYRKVTSTTAIPWRFDFTIENVKGTADLGQAVGLVTFKTNKFWLSSRKSSNWEQNLILGFDEIGLTSEGRLGGIVSLKKIQLSTAIMWQRHNGGIHPVPLVQAILGVERIESRISFDFHSFVLVYVNALHLSMFNQRDRNYILNDRLAAVGHCDTIAIYGTALAASNVLDLYYTLKRMRYEANASYDAILRDSAKSGTAEPKSKLKSDGEGNGSFKGFKPFEKLRTFLDFNVSLVSLYIYPDSLVDMQVFTITIRGAELRYSQEIELRDSSNDDVASINTTNDTSSLLSKTSQSAAERQLVCTLDMKLTELMVALSTYRKRIATVTALPNMPIEEYVARAKDIKGGTIIGIPVCDISMQTWQNFDEQYVVEYIFLSSFGGRVDVGWNLGSVQFIRDMWENHTKTFASRRETYEMRHSSAPGMRVLETLSSTIDEDDYDDDDDKEDKAAQPSPSSVVSQLESQLDSAIPELLEYKYRPLRPPVIAKPQLRDMGEATPPIEWIGLHRKRLPKLTHQAVIVSLQKMVEEIELLYRQVLGHS